MNNKRPINVSQLQSQTKIVGTLKLKPHFLPTRTSLFPPNVVYCDSVGKSCTPTLRGGEDTKRSQQFRLRLWHHLRKYLLTASNFKVICSRRKDHESLSAHLLRRKVVRTAAMRYGIQHKDEAANQYADQFGRAVYLVGLLSILPYRTLVLVLTEEFMTPLKMSHGDY